MYFIRVNFFYVITVKYIIVERLNVAVPSTWQREVRLDVSLRLDESLQPRLKNEYLVLFLFVSTKNNNKSKTLLPTDSL